MKFITKVATFTILLAVSSLALAQKTAGEAVDDGWIHTKVKTALVGHGSSGINIEVHHGVVQLAGFVEDEAHKKAATDAAANVEGVQMVSDALIIAAPGRSAGRTLDDNVITGRVKKALAASEVVSAADVNVEVNRGVVLLSGFVASNELRGKAITIAEGAEGVVEVINGMDIRD